MPIRPELLHLYNTLEYKRHRKAIVVERDGNRCQHCGREQGQPYLNKKNDWVAVQLGMAHLDQNPHNNADSNLAALCRSCHLAHDRATHLNHARGTRQTKKDAARPLLAAGEARV
jgi:hypothetical protein